MLQGMTQKLLGADASAIDAYNQTAQGRAWQNPVAWTKPHFSLKDFDLVFLPGGHEEGVRQIPDSARVHKELAEYFPLTKEKLRWQESLRSDLSRCTSPRDNEGRG